MLNQDLSVNVIFESSCMVDYYNNNMAGVSIGGSTTRYEEGQRIQKRNVTMGREYIDTSWREQKLPSTVEKINYNKLMILCREYVPEFDFMIP